MQISFDVHSSGVGHLCGARVKGWKIRRIWIPELLANGGSTRGKRLKPDLMVSPFRLRFLRPRIIETINRVSRPEDGKRDQEAKDYSFTWVGKRFRRSNL